MARVAATQHPRSVRVAVEVVDDGDVAKPGEPLGSLESAASLLDETGEANTALVLDARDPTRLPSDAALAEHLDRIAVVLIGRRRTRRFDRSSPGSTVSVTGAGTSSGTGFRAAGSDDAALVEEVALWFQAVRAELVGAGAQPRRVPSWNGRQ